MLRVAAASMGRQRDRLPHAYGRRRDVPEGTQVTLDLILTAAGASVAAGLIATILQALKRLPGLGPWLDENREPWAVLIVSVVLVAYAYIATTSTPGDPVALFAAFLAWVNIAALTSKAHDLAPEPLRRAIGGGE